MLFNSIINPISNSKKKEKKKENENQIKSIQTRGY